MNFNHDDELLDWDMQADENFDDALNETTQEMQKMTGGDIQETNASSPERWVQFRSDNEHPAFTYSTERRSGDGDSISSQDQGKHLDQNTDKNTSKESPKRPNSFSTFATQIEGSGLTRFTVLNEDEDEIGGYDPAPMEFRGTLTTGNQPYKNSGSCFCKFIRYIFIPLLTFSIGILVGFLVARSALLNCNTVVNVDYTANVSTTTRAVMTTSETFNASNFTTTGSTIVTSLANKTGI